MIVSHLTEQRLIGDILTALGAPFAQGSAQTASLVEADLRGRASHGLQRLPLLAQRIGNGVLVPGATPSMDWKSRVVAVADGGAGFGPWAGLVAMRAAAERASRWGIGVVAVKNSNHLGLLAPYVEQTAERGLIGVALTTSEALVQPWHGVAAMVGTNPIAIGIPAGTTPFILDMATGASSRGQIIDFANRSQNLPDGWAVDSAGDPTNDPVAALSGAIAPFGGAKGYGLGLGFELIVSALTSSAVGRDVVGTLDAVKACNKGDLFICIDPTVFGNADFALTISEYLDEIRTSASRAGGPAVRIPGDGARATRFERMRNGVDIADNVWHECQELHASLARGATADPLASGAIRPSERGQ